jgi:hypothetical protein
MGEVWRAFDTAMNRVVALKVLPPNFADDEQYQVRFRREAQAAAGLDEPHVQEQSRQAGLHVSGQRLEQLGARDVDDALRLSRRSRRDQRGRGDRDIGGFGPTDGCA